MRAVESTRRPESTPARLSWIDVHAFGTWAAIFLLAGVVFQAEAQSRFTSPPDLSARSADADLPDAPEPQASQATAPTATAPASIEGVVSNQDGAVYEGVHVSLTRPGASSPTPERTAVTDSNGHFLFPEVAPGPFLLSVTSEGFATQSVSGILKPGETYQAPAIVLPVSTNVSEIRVTASRIEIAQEELHMEEQQRVFGVLPNFYVVYDPHAPALTAKQKYQLAWRSNIDPITILIAAATAGVQQADNSFKAYGQGAAGYGKRFGADYADGFISNMLGGAVFPGIFKQDPRYFYKGTGTIRHRALYAIAASVICKGDNGHWQFNYSGLIGSMASGGISNIYYPAANRNGINLTLENTLYGIAGSAAGNLFQEFLVRKLTPRVPKYANAQP